MWFHDMIFHDGYPMAWNNWHVSYKKNHIQNFNIPIIFAINFILLTPYSSLVFIIILFYEPFLSIMLYLTFFS